MVLQIPPIVYPSNPVTNVQPFTFKDGATFLERLELFARYISREVIPFVNSSYNELSTEVQNQVNTLIASFNAAVEAIINNSIEVQDPVVATLIEDSASDAYHALETAVSALINSVGSGIFVSIADFNSSVTDITNPLYVKTSEFDESVASIIPFGQTRTALDAIYQTKVNLESAVNNLVNAGKVKISLDAAYEKKHVNPVIYAADYGVIADGTTDNTAALNAAVAAAGESAQLILPPGVIFKIGDTVINKSLHIIGNNTTIKCLNANCFTIKGKIASSANNVVADVSAQARTVLVDNSAGYAINDYIMLYDNTAYTATDKNYFSGEMHQIESISGNTITLAYPVRGSWGDADSRYLASAGTKIRKVIPITGSISGIKTITSTSGSNGGISLEAVKNYDVYNIAVLEGGGYGIQIRHSINVSVENSSIAGLDENVPDGIGAYGIAIIGACENVTISGIKGNKCRHVVTTIGSIYGMVHNLTITDCQIVGTTGIAIDTHAAGDGINIIGNTVINCPGGVQIRAHNVLVSNNQIVNCASYGILTRETNNQHVTIINNVIIGTSNIAIYLDGSGNAINVIGNIITNPGFNAISIASPFSDVMIARNIIKNVGRVRTLADGITSVAGSSVGVGWNVQDNIHIQNAGSASRAVNLLPGPVTGVSLNGNKRKGTFANDSTAYNVSSPAGTPNNINLNV